MGNMGGESANAVSNRRSRQLDPVIQGLKRAPKRVATKIMDKVMEALKDDMINIIGICGLGGTGKTTILHEVCERAITQNIFDEVAMTIGSQDTDLFRIQSDLACMLGLSNIENVYSIIARADLLHKRLTNNSRTLVILDDVWSEIKLKEVGIPVRNGRCKVVLTSRNESVCTSMGTQEIITVEVLSKKEAWHMFKTIAGDCVEGEKLEEIAKEVADECGGLPITLVTHAKALSNKNRSVWEDALRQLRQSRLGYNFLASEQLEAQQLLLICCQHPEDAEIEVENLARYCLALELFKNVNKIVDARNRTYAVINRLKDCFLLQVVDVDEGKRYEAVRMHDVVRDMCLSFVSEVKDQVYMHIMARDADGGYDLGIRNVDFPKLKLLMEAPLDGSLLDIRFLRWMKELRVFENLEGDEHHPPPALQFLSNLRMLSLERKSLSEEITSTIGNISKLEILSFWGSKISSFPRQIGQLSNLKLLDMRCAKGEGLIPSGILPGLKKLEVLCMGEFLLLGAAKDKDIQNRESHGRITELDSLSNLTNLQINLVDPKDLLDLQRFRFEKLESFFLGSSRDIGYKYRSTMHTLVRKSINLGNLVGMEWALEVKIEPIVRSTENLRLIDIEDWTNPLILEMFVCLNKLVLENCKQLEYIIPEGSLEELRRLVLSDMPMMRHLWVGPIDPLCLGNLIEVSIAKCPAIESMFHHSAAKCLVQLQTLFIHDCLMLKVIVSKWELGTTTTTTSRGAKIRKELFPKLRRLKLQVLPKLGGFCKLKRDDGTIQQPFLNPLVLKLDELKIITLWHLPNLKHLCGPIPKGIHAFQNLEDLDVQDCNNLGYLISSSMAHMLKNLKTLSVRRCKSMKEVIKMNKDCALKKIVFYSLSRVILEDLKNLSSFSSGDKQSLDFPLLGKVFIDNCPEMKTFCCGHLTAEKLHGVKVSHPYFQDDKLVWKSDLNDAVQQLNARINQMNSDLEKDDDPEDGISAVEYADEMINEGMSMKALMPLSVVSSPNASLTPDVVSPFPPISDNNEELANSSSLDLRKVALPPLIEYGPSASTEHSVHSSDSPLQPKADKELSDMSFSSQDNDWKRSRILIQGVYVKAESKTTFEEILTAKPNFLSGLRLRTVGMKTEAVESAIRSLQILRQRTAHTISSEELAYIKDSIDDLESNGLDTTWLKRGYQRAILEMKQQKMVSVAAQLVTLEKEETEDEAAFEMARAKLEESKARRAAFKAEHGALMQELEAGKELIGGGFDSETSLGDGLLD